MNNDTYWQNRAAWNMFHFMDEAEVTADQIAEIYFKSSRWLSYQAEEIFDKFMTKHELTETEARQLLNKLQDRTSLDEMLRALENEKSDDRKRELLKELEAPAYQARLEKLRQLQNQIDMVMQQVYKQEKNFQTKFYTDLANEAYYRSMFEIQQRAGYAFSFNHISRKQIDSVLAMNWSGIHYSKRIWNNTTGLAKTLKEELLINLLTGRTERETAQNIANKFAQGASAARRLVRTESCFISTELNFKAYEEAGIEKCIFLATLDLRTSKICRSLDGEIFLVCERCIGKNCPPMHPWCRSTTICFISEDELADMKRRAYNPKTRRTELVPATMKYQEWYDRYVKGNPEAELQEKMEQNRSADQKQHERYRKVLGEAIPESFAKFQDMKYNKTETWEEMKAAYRDVNWQREALEKHSSGEVRKVPYEREANSVFDKMENGKVIQRRFYGKTGKPRLDIDMTDHGNPKEHPVAPHYHNWTELQDGKLQRDAKHDAPLRLGHKIANKDLLKG